MSKAPDLTLHALIQARSVAVIGASDDPTRIGGRPIAYMRARGYEGEILPVNPTRSTVQGLAAFPGVEALPYSPETAIVAVPAPQVPGVVRALGELGVRSAVVFTSGFAETGDAGRQAQEELVAQARGCGLRLLGPNTLGLYNDRTGFYPIFSTSFESGWPHAGRVGIASQSGAFAAHIFTSARERRIGVPVCITTGNEGDITLGEAMQWLVHDPDTDVVAVYAEGLREAPSFLAALAAAHAARKPVVLMKTGRSAVGLLAAQAHTSAVAGDDRVFDAVLADYGVVRARSAEEFLDIAHLATRRIYPANNTLGVLTISGGAGVLISDVCADLGLPMPEMPAAAQEELKALIPFASVRNPVDCTAQVLNDPPAIGRFAHVLADAGGYRSILGFFTQSGGVDSIAPQLLREISAVKRLHPDRLFVMQLLGTEALVAEYEAAGIPVFSDPTRATNAIHAMGRFGEAFARELRMPRTFTASADGQLPAHAMNEAETKAWLAGAGIACAPEATASGADAAVECAGKIGYPVVLKILSPDIAHKSEIGGVMMDIRSPSAARQAFATLIDRTQSHAPQARIHGVLVAKQLDEGIETILGVHHDPLFGPVLLFGLGGVFVEVLDDVALCRCPVDRQTAECMIRSIRGAPLLIGARGRPCADVGALAETMVRLSELAAGAGPRLRGIDLNPVFVLPAGKGCFAADALLDLQPQANA